MIADMAGIRLPIRSHPLQAFVTNHYARSFRPIVASMVAFDEGVPDKSGYRRYKLREVQRNDDFAAMKEAGNLNLNRDLVFVGWSGEEMGLIGSRLNALAMR